MLRFTLVVCSAYLLSGCIQHYSLLVKSKAEFSDSSSSLLSRSGAIEKVYTTDSLNTLLQSGKFSSLRLLTHSQNSIDILNAQVSSDSIFYEQADLRKAISMDSVGVLTVFHESFPASFLIGGGVGAGFLIAAGSTASVARSVTENSSIDITAQGVVGVGTAGFILGGLFLGWARQHETTEHIFMRYPSDR